MKLNAKWTGFFFYVFMLFNNVMALDVPSLSQERIEQARCAIAKELLINKVMRCSIMAGGAAGASYIAYQTWNKFYAAEGAFDKAVYPPFGSWLWWTRMFHITRDALISAALTKGLVASGESMMERLFHAGDIQWFIKSHTHLPDTLKELRQFAYVLDGKDQHSPAETHYAQQSLIITIKSLIAQLERLSGFMLYKVGRIKAQENVAALINEIPQYLKELVEQLLHAYKAKMNNGSINLSDRVIYFESELTNLASRFAHLQQDIEWIK